MKKSLILPTCFLILAACSREVIEPQDTAMCSSLDDIQSSFAQILSEAVYDKISLRSFIRETALNQFDCDYDVFYPFVKDLEVES